MIIASRSFVAVPPGETIREQLADKGMDLAGFAARMGIDASEGEALLEGKTLLTADAARRLEEVLGVPADFWLRLEENYREKILLVQKENGAA